MTFGEVVEEFGARKIRISGEEWVNALGERKWSKPLTDAQIIAYSSLEVDRYFTDNRDNALYCVLFVGGVI